MSLAIDPRELAIVQEVLIAHLGVGIRAWVYGSRGGGGSPRRRSDLDLLIDAGRPVDHSVMSELQDAFGESLLPYSVDLHDRHRTEAVFLERIAPTLVALPMPASVQSG